MRAILILHGIGSSNNGRKVNKIKEMFNAKFFSPNFPQHGDNKNNFEIKTIIEELDKIIEEMKNFEEKYLIARSFGGYITLMLLQKYPNFFDKVCLLSPAVNMFNTMKNLIEDGYITNEFKLGDSQLVSPDYFKDYDKEIKKIKFKSPILIIHGTEDITASYQDLKDFLKEKTGFDLALFNVAHSYGEKENLILGLVENWFKE